MDFQFYPSGPELSLKAGKLFKKPVTRLLEPSAGRGDLLSYIKTRLPHGVIDCVEIDPENRTILKGADLNVVGTDFLTFSPGPIYSHIIMNPPFKNGAEHVLHAWDLLYSGELVAILNAETVRNPFSASRQHLCDLIDQYSGTSPEFIEEAFETPDTKRKTSVEIVLIHLVKPTQSNFDFVAKMRKEQLDQTLGGERFESSTDLMLPGAELENRLIDFKCAVKAMRLHRHAEVRAYHFKSRLGKALNDPTLDDEPKSFDGTLIEAMHKDYQALKDAAWSGVIRSVDVRSRLSSQAQRKIESQFEDIRKMEFTMENIQGLVRGLVMQQGEIQTDMLCEVFDLFTRYYLDNRCYYKGWKSNNKHRQNAFRLKKSRIVLPSRGRTEMSDWGRAAYEDRQIFADMDKAFAMLDGKTFDSINGLYRLFDGPAKVPSGERIQTEYFDVRVFYKAGTFHLFPRSQTLIDRLNRFIGKHRNWIPHDDSAAPEGFWEQFEAAEKVTAGMSYGGLREWDVLRAETDKDSRVLEMLDRAITEAQAKIGIEFFPDAIGQEAHSESIMIPSKVA